MTLVVDIFRKYLPFKHKKTPSGWVSFNAPCCHQRGHKPDDRQRAGVNFSNGFVYNCFNCNYTASWQPGRQITQKLKNLMRWLGASDDDINRMVFEALKSEASDQPTVNSEMVVFTKKELPEGSLPISEWTLAELDDNTEEQLAKVVGYVAERGFDPINGRFYWSPMNGMEERVIIPFTWGDTVVGYTARKIREGKPKYLSDQHPTYVFNLDKVTQEQEYVFAVEGPFDAMAVRGVALLHNEISDQQARMINKLGKRIIVIPDQDRSGLTLVDHALKNDWAVAFPNWEDDVKDCAEAVERYGNVFVTVDAIKTAVDGAIKINLYKKQLERKLAAREKQ
jgi:hypothetical protein